MTLEQLQELKTLSGDDLKRAMKILTTDPLEGTENERTPLLFREEYEGKRTRRTTSVGMKKDFEVPIFSETEYDTNPVTGEQIPKQIGTRREESAKLVFPFPEEIVETAVAFLFGGELSVESTDQSDAFNTIRRDIKKKLRLQALLKEFARTGLVETKVAILFYLTEKTATKEQRVKGRVFSQEDGDFYPTFDDYGDMIAFTRVYESPLNGEDEIYTIAEIFTETEIQVWLSTDGGNKWELSQEESRDNPFEKIPVVYYDRRKPLWDKVAVLIDKYENRMSRLSDTNDYFSEPIIMIHGEPINLPAKGSVGKLIQFEEKRGLDGVTNSGKAEYLTWDQTPGSMDLELKTLKEAIYRMTKTVDLSFENLKGMGNALSGNALEFLFTGTRINTERLKEDFDVVVERCISILIKAYELIGLRLNESEIDIYFSGILPHDLKDELNLLGSAVSDGLLSRESAIMQNRLVDKPTEEFAKIKAEEAERGPNLSDIMGSGM